MPLPSNTGIMVVGFIPVKVLPPSVDKAAYQLPETRITSPTAGTIWKWVFYLMRVGSQGMLIWYFISYILLMFNTRNAMPRK